VELVARTGGRPRVTIVGSGASALSGRTDYRPAARLVVVLMAKMWLDVLGIVIVCSLVLVLVALCERERH
jgi:hypothetical protein